MCPVHGTAIRAARVNQRSRPRAGYRIVVDAPLEQARPCRLVAPLELGAPLAQLVEHAKPFAFCLRGVRFGVLGEVYPSRVPP